MTMTREEALFDVAFSFRCERRETDRSSDHDSKSSLLLLLCATKNSLENDVLCGINSHDQYFALPKVEDFSRFQKDVVEHVKPQHGTTTLGFIFEHGIIIAVDSRASQGP